MGSPQGAARNASTNLPPINGVSTSVLQALTACVSGVAAFIIEYADQQIALRRIGRAT